MQPNAVAQPPVSTPQPAPAQSMDVVASRSAPAPVTTAPVPTDAAQTSHQNPSTKNPVVLAANVKPAGPQKSAPAGSNTDMAVVATVVIILGLAAMAVYAYVRQMA